MMKIVSTFGPMTRLSCVLSSPVRCSSDPDSIWGECPPGAFVQTYVGVTPSTVSRRTAVSAYTRPRVNLPSLNS